MNISNRHKRSVRLTDAQENEIRRRFFKLQHDPYQIARDYKIGESRMRVIVGGPLDRRYDGPERWIK